MAVGEFHEEVFYSGTLVGEVPQVLYDHTKAAASNGQMQIVNDGLEDAVYVGSAFGTVPTLGSEWLNNDFIVVEPIEAYPGGGGWQIAIIKTGASTVGAILAPDGGWSSVDVTPGNNYGFGDGLPGSTIITDILPFIGGTLPSLGSLRISSCNLDTYDSGTKRYTYLRIFSKPAGAADSDEALRVGGFIPTNFTAETKPVCINLGQPELITSAGWWGGTAAAPASNDSRTPYDFPPRTRQMGGPDAMAALCYVDGLKMTGYSTDRSNQAIALTLRLVGTSDGKVIGSYGAFDMKTFATDIADYEDDGGPNYFSHEGFLFRFKP